MNKKTVSARELIDGEPRARILSAPVDGIGMLDIYELTVAERRRYFEDSQLVADSNMSDDEFVAKWLKRLLFGAENIDDQYFEKLFDKLSQVQVEQVLSAGVRLTLEQAIKK